MSDITVVIPSMPERADFLTQAQDSVYAQSLQPKETIWKVTEKRRGEFVRLTNELVQQVSTDWWVLLCDDDLFDPDHLETLAAQFGEADIVYSWARVEGYNVSWQRPFDAEDLRRGNYIPGSAAAIRTRLWELLGGYRDVIMEDWDFWVRALESGAEFRCVERATWTHRYSPAWPHHSQGNLHDPVTTTAYDC